MEFLRGKWLGHPLHPAVVHIPVGAWVIAAILDLVEPHVARGRSMAFVALACVILGLVGALMAVPTGIAEWTPIKKEKPAWKLGLYHLVLNLLAGLAWAVDLGLRWKAWGRLEPVPGSVVVVSVMGALLVVGSGYLGTLMAFDQGTSVARLSKKKWRALAVRGGAHVPESK